MASLLGDEFPAFLSSFPDPSQAGLRVNTIKLLPEAYQELSPFMLTPVPWCSSGFLTQPDNQPGKHPHHTAGLFYLQEPSAMAVAEILAPQPGERVLDLSAAPGGKATHIAALMQNYGMLVANEIHPKRVWDLAENLERCGVRIAAVTNETPERLAAHFGPFFDRVLLDAPCSGEGMFRKSAIARASWNPEFVQGCSLRQQAILPLAAQMVRPGGVLEYSTCTFSPEENELVIERFLQTHPHFDLLPIPKVQGFSSGLRHWAGKDHSFPLDQTVRIWPHSSVGEGHFIALLRCQGQPATFPPPLPPKRATVGLSPQQAQIFKSFVSQTLANTELGTRLGVKGSYLYWLPEGLADLSCLKVIHPGWWLGVFKKDRFEPSHALALAITSKQAQRTIHLTSDSSLLSQYFHGESFPNSGEDGWILITLDGFPIGWGKRVQGVVKNAYPRGLRWL